MNNKNKLYWLIATYSNGECRILGKGSKAQVLGNLNYLRKNGLPGFRYTICAADKKEA